MVSYLGVGAALFKAGRAEDAIGEYRTASPLDSRASNYYPLYAAALETAIAAGYLDIFENVSLPPEWKGPDMVDMRDLNQTAPPLTISGGHGHFVFSHPVGEENPPIRISPAVGQADRNEYVIYFGLSFEDKGNGLQILGYSPKDTGNIKIEASDIVITGLRARLSAPSEQAGLFIEDNAEGWKRNKTPINGTAWQHYASVREIRPGATRVVLGVSWVPADVRDWLEVNDMRVFVISNGQEAK